MKVLYATFVKRGNQKNYEELKRSAKIRKYLFPTKNTTEFVIND